MLNVIKRFVKEEEGATMVEYGLMVALIAVVCILVITALGSEVGLSFDKTQKAVSDSNDGSKQIQVTP